MSDSETNDAPEEKPDAGRRRRRMAGTGIVYAFGVLLTLAWIVFLVWLVGQIV